MRILYFSRGYTPHDHRFLSAICEAGHDAYFLRETNHSSDPRLLPDGVHPVKGKLSDAIQAVQPDLVHAGPLDGPAYQAARSDFHPLVAMSWGSDILHDGKRNPFVRRRISKALQQADAVIGDCNAVRQVAIGYGVRQDRIVTFPWGIDLQRFSPGSGTSSLRGLLGWQKSFVLLHVRSWEPLYDPLTVARIFVVAARENPSLRLLMPGSGSLKPRLIQIFTKAGLQDRVHLPGPVSQEALPRYYQAADLYVSASLSDGSSVSLMEAMACGLPSLVSDIPGNREWIRPGMEGWLFPATDERRLATLMLEASESPKLSGMASSARQIAEELADWSRNKQGLFKAYALAMEADQ